MYAGQVRSAAIAGTIALVIYVVIALLTGQSAAGAFGFGIALGLVTAAITFIVSTVIARSRSGRA